MKMTDKLILRELAQKYAEIANDPVNAERIRRARSNNDLKPVRPLVWIEELPWHEMDINDELTLRCEDAFAQDMERFFRRTLYRWKHFQVDMIVENFYPVYKACDDNGLGLSVSEDAYHTDIKNNIYSHYYRDQLDSIDKIGLLQMPVIKARPDKDEENIDRVMDAIGDILPVGLLGGCMHFPAWDRIVMLHGVENSLADLIADPELMHAIVGRFAEICMSRIAQMNEQKLFDSHILSLHCTPGLSDELDAQSAAGYAGTSRCTWFRSMAQSFSSVSPEMHYEFDIKYFIPAASQFGMTYYGCCEPLFDRIEQVKRFPNLRKIGVSAWSDVDKSAEQIGSDFVFSRKPNPAQVAVQVDADAVRADLRKTLDAVKRNNCPCDITLKDISTVSYRPQNIFEWAKIAEETVDEYYG